MKPEVRILYTRCLHDLCASAVTRGKGFDVVLLARGCEELCKRLEREGFAQELRYSMGDCDCGFPRPPRDPKVNIYPFLEDLVVTATEFIANKPRGLLQS
ncbi:MAG: hypothetical protein NZ902_01745 [Acidilobaceae archaeon]|nr:hypothetical protein [Acidilobaceae archaeon]MDW7973975.1 hypothetical protein [Sulfolobales archaeon]